MVIKIINKSSHPMPHYETEASAGMDLRANNENPILLKPLERTIVKTGLFIELPIGFEAQVRRTYSTIDCCKTRTCTMGRNH